MVRTCTKGRPRFLHPTHPQNNSKLLQLPVELRQKILRNLLKKDGPIKSRTQYRVATRAEDSDLEKAHELWPGLPFDISNVHNGNLPIIEADSQYDAESQFSSQLLRCCQLLNADGRAILYAENEIAIFCQCTGPLGAPRLEFSMLSRKYPGNCGYIAPQQMKFGGLRLVMDLREPDDLLRFCIEAKRITERKRVFIQINNRLLPGDHNGSTEGPLGISQYIRTLEYIRCVEVDFSGLPEEVDTERLRSIMTGPVCDQDLLSEFSSMHCDFHNLQCRRDARLQTGKSWDALVLALLHHDEEAYRVAEIEYYKAAHIKIQEWWDNRIQQINHEVEGITRNIQRRLRRAEENSVFMAPSAEAPSGQEA